MQCAAQLKHHIARREAEKDAKNRRKNLTKCVRGSSKKEESNTCKPCTV
jgi:CRISPR/Cas system CMR subunit Cmr4 (Cas7 group RAMP superfamily)